MKFSDYLKATNGILNKLNIYNSSSIKINEEVILKFEETYGVKLPPDYKNYMLKYNGGLPRPNRFNIDSDEPINTMTSILTLFSLNNDDKLNNIDSYINPKLLKNNKIIPIAADVYDGIICLSLTDSKYGNIYYSEQFIADNSPKNFILLGNGFNNFLNKLTY